MSNTPLLIIEELPDLTLKEIDVSSNFEDVIERFNYNMNQILNHYKRTFDISVSEIVVPRGLPGLSVTGAKGDKGNIFRSSSSLIIDKSISLYDEGDLVVDPSGSIFTIVRNPTTGLNENIFTLIITNKHTYFVRQSSMSDVPTSHGFLNWDDAGNDGNGNLTATTSINGDYRYYRMILGDYKRNAIINSTATFTNILEARSDNGNVLTDNASDLSKSRDFAQIAIKYRETYTTEADTSTVYHKFHKKSGTHYVYDISNGGAGVEISKSNIFPKLALSLPNNVNDGISLNGDVISFLKGKMRLHEKKVSGVSTFYMESVADGKIDFMHIHMNLDVTGSLNVATALNVSGATALASLNVSGASSLTSLNVSGATTLASLNVSGASSLVSLNVSNGATIAGGAIITGGANISSLVVTNSSTFNTATFVSLSASDTIYAKNITGVATGLPIISNGYFNFANMLANGMDSALLTANFVKDANYVHTDNNLTTALKNQIGITSPPSDWLSAINTPGYILNKPNLVSQVSVIGVNNIVPLNSPLNGRGLGTNAGMYNLANQGNAIRVSHSDGSHSDFNIPKLQVYSGTEKVGLGVSNGTDVGMAMTDWYTTGITMIFHPHDKSQYDVVGVMCSFNLIRYSGDVDDNDQTWLTYRVEPNAVVFHSGTSEAKGDMYINWMVIYK